MIIKFDKEYLSELYYKGQSSDKKYRFQPAVIKKYILRIITLADAPNTEVLYPLNSLNYEVLSGSKSGISSIRIDKQFRLEFTVTHSHDGEIILTVCPIIDITNHYK